MDSLTGIRPKLKQDTVFLQTDELVFFQTEKEAFRLKGKSIAGWLSALAPRMTGEYTLEQLCQDLDPARRDMVVRLVNTLLQRGVLKNVQPESPALLPEAVGRQFRSQLEFIDHFVDRPQERFKRFRESRILLVGSGESYTSLAICLIRNGLRELLLAPTDGADEYLEKIEPEADLLRQNGCEVLVSPVDFTPQLTSGNLQANNYDIIVYCADNQSLKDIFTLNQLCIKEGHPFLPAFVFAGQAMLGPYFKPPQGPCWLCLLMRLSASMDAEDRSALWSELVFGNNLPSNQFPVFTPVARRIGNGLGFELFKLFSGILPTETEGGVIFQDLKTLESFHGKLVAHPLCSCRSQQSLDECLQQLQDVVAGKREHASTQEEVFQQLFQLIDPRLGPFHKFADDDIIQLPLKVTRLVVGSSLLSNRLTRSVEVPSSIDTSVSSIPASLAVVAYDLENVVNARQTAFLHAVRDYSQAIPDRGRMLSASLRELQVGGKAVFPAQKLTTWSGIASLKPETRTEWLPAWSLSTQRVCYVPAAAVYPNSPLNRSGIFERTLAGACVGSKFTEALNVGMTEALGYEQVRDLIGGSCSSVELDIDELKSLDADLAFLVKSAQRFDRSFTILAVLSESPLAVMIVYTSDAHTGAEQFFAVGCSLSGPDAAKKALLQFVGDLQFLEAEGKRPAAVDALFPEFSPRTPFARRDAIASSFRKPGATIKQLEEYLYESRRDALFVNTTPRDIWEMVPLISGTVLLTRATMINQDWR